MTKEKKLPPDAIEHKKHRYVREDIHRDMCRGAAKLGEDAYTLRLENERLQERQKTLEQYIQDYQTWHYAMEEYLLTHGRWEPGKPTMPKPPLGPGFEWTGKRSMVTLVQELKQEVRYRNETISQLRERIDSALSLSPFSSHPDAMEKYHHNVQQVLKGE